VGERLPRFLLLYVFYIFVLGLLGGRRLQRAAQTRLRADGEDLHSSYFRRGGVEEEQEERGSWHCSAVLLMQLFCNRAASMQSPPSAAAKQMQLSYVGRKTAVDSLQIASFAAIIDVDERCDCKSVAARHKKPCAASHTAISQAARITLGVAPARETYVRL
jgi:hypothetical protein